MVGNYIIVGAARGPSDRPYQHSTLASAKAECARLARSNPGQEFTIYRSVVTARRSDISWNPATPIDGRPDGELDDDIPF